MQQETVVKVDGCVAGNVLCVLTHYSPKLQRAGTWDKREEGQVEEGPWYDSWDRREEDQVEDPPPPISSLMVPTPNAAC